MKKNQDNNLNDNYFYNFIEDLCALKEKHSLELSKEQNNFKMDFSFEKFNEYEYDDYLEKAVQPQTYFWINFYCDSLYDMCIDITNSDELKLEKTQRYENPNLNNIKNNIIDDIFKLKDKYSLHNKDNLIFIVKESQKFFLENYNKEEINKFLSSSQLSIFLSEIYINIESKLLNDKIKEVESNKIHKVKI